MFLCDVVSFPFSVKNLRYEDQDSINLDELSSVPQQSYGLFVSISGRVKESDLLPVTY